MTQEDIYQKVEQEKQGNKSGYNPIWYFCLYHKRNNFSAEDCHKFFKSKYPKSREGLDKFKKIFEKIRVAPSSNQSKGGDESQFQKLQKFVSLYYELRYDRFKRATFFRRIGDQEWIYANDYVINTIWFESQEKAQLKFKKNEIANILDSSFVKEGNELDDFFNSLPKPDPSDDYIDQIVSSLSVRNQSHFHKFFPYWIIGMVDSYLNPEATNPWILVFYGKQGVGKSTFFRKLAEHFQEFFIAKIPSDIRTKDFEIVMAQHLLYVIEEIDGLNFSDNQAMKDKITTQKVNARPTYGKKHEKFPRLVTFAGTTNRKHILSDPSGSRRFLCFEILSFNQSEPLPIREAFAQAKHLAENGFRYHPNQEEINEVEKANVEFQYLDPEEELLQYLTINPKTVSNSEESQFLPVTALLEKLQFLGGFNRNYDGAKPRRLTTALLRRDYPYKILNGQKVYGVIFQPPGESVPEMENTETLTLEDFDTVDLPNSDN